ncbi:hypothetical protein VFPPC_16359 [Pochonia chlamydosporia 170]|uniref:Uncharacterized protein n=1 Tax=Pochonia chlamydosporia 170 TaxID=1380566 RepID=A0A179FAW3_METCM|nr:hypothetical protein VFPPC_16359 [Pochonia chlamydosporia 170]OAQ62612.1 hypothetical protein VFPPC_16359 [Pochonia chlamydosporia 170]
MKNAAVVTAIKPILVPHMATMSALTRRSHQTSFPLPRHVIFYALNGTALTIANGYHRCMPEPAILLPQGCASASIVAISVLPGQDIISFRQCSSQQLAKRLTSTADTASCGEQ